MNKGFKKISRINYSIAIIFLCVAVMGNLFLNPTGAWLNDYIDGNSGVFIFKVIDDELLGAGDSSDPYQISNFFHLNKVREDLSAHYILTSDLGSSTPGYNLHAGSSANEGSGWDPIGYGSENRFEGFFNGDGHTISDIYINRPLTDNVGLFGHMGISSTDSPTIIENVLIVNVDITGNRGVGSLVGRVTGNQNTLIKNSGVLGGTVSGTGATGGLVGSNNSYQLNGASDRNPRIETSFSKVDVIAERPETGAEARPFEKFGGLVGCSQKGTLADSYSLSNVTIKEDNADRVGGLVGCNILNGRVARSYSAGFIILEAEASETTNIGVLIGNSDTAQGNIISLSNNYYANDIIDNAATNGVGNYETTPTGVNSRNTDDMKGLDVLTSSTKMDLLDTILWNPTIKMPIINADGLFEQAQLDAQGIEN